MRIQAHWQSKALPAHVTTSLIDGPMEGHEPGMPVHYDLHAWIYRNNPAGELSAWNPRNHC